MIVLGISGLYHDSAAALVQDGEIIAAAQEERFTRIKHDSSLPVNAIKYCLHGYSIYDVDKVVFYDNPLLSLNRIISNIEHAGSDISELVKGPLEHMLSERLWVHEDLRRILGRLGLEDKLMVTKHHFAHAASAFYPSPFKNAAIITIDGVGEWSTNTIGFGEDNSIILEEEIRYPDSLGLLYSAFTYYCGFKVNSGDYKLMGLSPYGSPIYADIIRDKIIDIKEDGSYELNMEYFDYQYGRTMISAAFEKLFKAPRRTPESKITRRYMDVAASVQNVLEDVVLKQVKHAKKLYGDRTNNLVLAGGVALNCVANGKVKRQNIFDNIWIQPAAGDAGGALGAALYYTYAVNKAQRLVNGITDTQKGSYLGPEYKDDEIEEFLLKNNFTYKKIDKDEELWKYVAVLLSEQMVIGLFQGRMEYGPRALGNRSIIADPRSETMQSRMNTKIKFRESFRPFAPSVMKELAGEYFDLEGESPYMLLCDDVKESIRSKFDLKAELYSSDDNMLDVINKARSSIPAVTHVDYSARIQTVTKESNPFYYGIINEFHNLTGCGVVVNTSFNVRGEPIVCTPEDACRCFMSTDMDILVIGHYILRKNEQKDMAYKSDLRLLYELD